MKILVFIDNFYVSPCFLVIYLAKNFQVCRYFSLCNLNPRSTYTETIRSICEANHLTGFYMRRTLVTKGLISLTTGRNTNISKTSRKPKRLK